MPHPAPAHKSFADRNSLYQEITNKIIAQLEQGRVPWVQPWGNVSAPLGLPRNAATRRPYTGVNILILWFAIEERGFRTQNWLTFRQALKIGAHVRKGEKGTTVFYADRFIARHTRRGNRRRAVGYSVSEALHRVQCRPMRRVFRLISHRLRNPSPKTLNPAAGRRSHPRDRRRYPRWRESCLLCPQRRLHPGDTRKGPDHQHLLRHLRDQCADHGRFYIDDGVSRHGHVGGQVRGELQRAAGGDLAH